jgi:hypothetical protein
MAPGKLNAEQLENLRRKIAVEKRDRVDKNAKLRLRWSQAELKLPAYRAGPAPNAEKIKANFFKITLMKDPKTNAPGPTLQKYKIILGDINGHEPTNRKTREYLIKQLLARNPPQG